MAKTRHIEGVIGRIQQLIEELISQAKKINQEQEEFMEKLQLDLVAESNLAKRESEIVQDLYYKFGSTELSKNEEKIFIEFFNTQKKHSLYLAKKVQEKAEQNLRLIQLQSNQTKAQLELILHKKEILAKAIKHYYNQSDLSRKNIEDVLYGMMENIENFSFYEYAFKLNLD